MERYTSQQLVKIIKIYYLNSESVASTCRALRPIYGRNNRPSSSTVERLVEKIWIHRHNTNCARASETKKCPSVKNIVAAEASIAQMCLSHVGLKRWASLWRRCGEFCEMILA